MVALEEYMRIHRSQELTTILGTFDAFMDKGELEALRRNGDDEIRSHVAVLLETGRAVLCDMVILELRYGARGTYEQSKIRQITETLDRVPTTDEVWAVAYSLATVCRTRGITVPATDLLIAAPSRVHGLELLENDKHFQMIPGDTET